MDASWCKGPAVIQRTPEHVLDTKQFLGEAARSLRAGGTILLTVPFAARWHFVPYDYWRFTPSSMDHLLREAGFAGVRVYARGNSGTVARSEEHTSELQSLR